MSSPEPGAERRHTTRSRGFSLRRLWMALATEPTRLVELLLAVFFFLLRGSFLIQFGYEYGPVEVFLNTVYLNEGRVGGLCVIVGLLHVYSAVTERPALRAYVALLGVALSLVVIVAFRNTEPHWHPVAMIWISVLLTELYIMIRHFITGRENKRKRAST